MLAGSAGALMLGVAHSLLVQRFTRHHFGRLILVGAVGGAFLFGSMIVSDSTSYLISRLLVAMGFFAWQGPVAWGLRITSE